MMFDGIFHDIAEIRVKSQIPKTHGSMSIRYWSDVKVSDWYLIDVNPRIFDVWDVALYGFA